MKIRFLFLILITFPMAASAQWIKQSVETTASFRSLSVVSEKVVWASGTGGTVIRTVDDGKTWTVITVPGAEKLDFRNIEAFDANTAYILSIGNGEDSRIYKTTDGGKTWQNQFTNKNPKAFFDAIACWDRDNCIAMSDPVDGKYVLIKTRDGGKSWNSLDTAKMPPAKEGEAAFAASGTCLITQGRNTVFLLTGGSDARVFRSTNRGQTWIVSDTPIISGTPGSGIFSIAMRDSKNGVIVGGNYEKPEDNTGNLAFTRDGSVTWMQGRGLRGYRSGVAYYGKKTVIAVGANGADISTDGGKTWRAFGNDNLNSVQTERSGIVWAVGPSGSVLRTFVGTITLDG